MLLIVAQIIGAPARSSAQEEPRSRNPILNKITGGSSHQAFSGKVQSVDLKRSLLKVDTVEGGATEFFPLKRNVSVSMANGARAGIKDLKPGTNVIVYYDQKEDRRTVSQIVVLSASGAEEKKKSPPPS